MKSPIITAMKIPQEQKNRYTDMQVLRSAAGFYVGILFNDPEIGFIPGTRESLRHFDRYGEAFNHLLAIMTGKAATRMTWPGRYWALA